MIVSIDIGTSYCSMCILDKDGRAQPVDISTGASMYGGKYSLPSAVFLERSGELLVGQAAMNSRITIPQNFHMEFKRELGQDVPIILGDMDFSPEELYTVIFRHMKSCVHRVKNEKIELACLTYPASYGRRRQEKLRQAAQAAGLFSVQLVDEPVAAAMSYYSEGMVQEGQTLLVYDFGGGTFDAALLRYENGHFCQMATPEGLERCGGIDMDRLIFQDICRTIEPALLDRVCAQKLHRLRLESQLSEMAIKAKHHLSAAQEFREDLVLGLETVPYHLSRERFEGMIASLVGQTIALCRDMLSRAQVDRKQLSSVLLVGGASRVPLVQQMVQQFAEGVPVLCAHNLDLAVAQGALMMACFDSRSKETREVPSRQEEACARRARTDACRVQHKQAVHASQNRSQSKRNGMEQRTGSAACPAQTKKQEQSDPVMRLRIEAEHGSAAAQYQLGLCYEHGDGIPKDPEEAVRWYHMAAQQGYMVAQFALGICYRMGMGVSQSDQQAVKWYRMAAQQGHSDAQNNLAACCRKGIGTPRDEAEAVRWYLEAAKRGHQVAQYNLALCYRYGTGVKKDEKQAVEWYRRAAEQGEREAQNALGICCIKGIGMEKNEAEAVRWYRKAAEQGYVRAQKNLADCYRYGIGVPKNEWEAAKWYGKVEKQKRSET